MKSAPRCSAWGVGQTVSELWGGALSLRGGLAHRQRDGVTLPDGALDPTSVDGLRTNTDLDELDGFTSIRWSNPSGRSVGFTLSALDAEKGVPPEEHISAPRLWRYPYRHPHGILFFGQHGHVRNAVRLRFVRVRGGPQQRPVEDRIVRLPRLRHDHR
jgi:hypothetical protein